MLPLGGGVCRGGRGRGGGGAGGGRAPVVLLDLVSLVVDLRYGESPRPAKTNIICE